MARAPIVLSFHEVLLHQSDIELLEGPFWLNDTIISFYFEYLQNVVFGDNEQLLFVSPEVTQCIKMVGAQEIKTFLEPLEVHKKKFIFFALNDNESPDKAGGTHWSLLVFSRPESCFYHLDSSSNTNHNVAYDFASHLMSFFVNDGGINFANKECLQQSNGYDCGMHVICNAERIAQCAQSYGSINTCNVKGDINLARQRNEILQIIMNLSSNK